MPGRLRSGSQPRNGSNALIQLHDPSSMYDNSEECIDNRPYH